jgi:cobalamin biosynthesis Mg chelatase CobN
MALSDAWFVRMEIELEHGNDRPSLSRPTSKGDVGEIRTTTETRQGVTGQNVRTVLWVGTIAIVVLFAIIYFVMA